MERNRSREQGQGSTLIGTAWLEYHSVRLALLTFVLFALLMVLIGLHLADGVDLGAARASHSTLGPLVEPRFTVVALLWAPEASVLYGLLAALLLWWKGWGVRSAAPLSFLLLVPVEVLLKYTLHRPPLPVSLNDWPPYPWINPSFGGDGGGGYYLSGSAIRTAFFCLLLAVALWEHGGRRFRAGSAVAATATLIFGLIRVYGGYHWLTAELSGQLLGAALVFLIAPWLVYQSGKRSSKGKAAGTRRHEG